MYILLFCRVPADVFIDFLVDPDLPLLLSKNLITIDIFQKVSDLLLWCLYELELLFPSRYSFLLFANSDSLWGHTGAYVKYFLIGLH